MSYKLYSIIPSSSLGETIATVDEILKISSSQYLTDLTSPKRTRANTYYPDRVVTSSFATASFTGFGLYKLTDAEANTIKTDPLVSSVRLISTQSYETQFSASSGPEIPEYINTGSISGSTYDVESPFDNNPHIVSEINIDNPTLFSTLPSRNFRQYAYTSSHPNYDFLEGIEAADISNNSTYYHSLPQEKMYSGSFGKETSRMLGNNLDLLLSMQPFAGANGTNGNTPYTNIQDYNYSADGADVDMVIWEGEGGMEWNHAEFYGVDGNTRVQFINWIEYGMVPTQLIGFGYGWQPQTPQDWLRRIYKSVVKNPDQANAIPHHQRVAMCAAGLTSGFAKGANICYICTKSGGSQNYYEMIDTLNVLKTWDANKPINPKTGRRNRTVVNVSFAPTNLQFPVYHFMESSSIRVSGSVKITNTHDYPAIRFASQMIAGCEGQGRRVDFVFGVSSSNGKSIEATVNKCSDSISAYYTSSFSSIATDMNRRLNPLSSPLGWSCSISTVGSDTYLHFTSSNSDGGAEWLRSIPIRIYTGSIYDFAHHGDISPSYSSSSPGGGSLVFLESGSSSPKTNISKIVVKGNLVYTGSTDSTMGDTGRSNGFIHADHGFHKIPPRDHYGLDRGCNKFYSNLPGSAAGRTRGLGSEHTPTLAQALKECAEQGIIIVQSAGNDGVQMTMASSSLENNSLYDPDLYSDELWNTYIEYDRELVDYRVNYTSTFSQISTYPEGPIPAHTPIRLGNPMWANNHSTIQVGGMSLQGWHDDWGLNELTRTLSGGLYIGASLNNITKDRIFPQMRKCYGKAISTYAVDGHQTVGGTSQSIAYRNQQGTNTGDYSWINGISVNEFIADSSTFYNNITFNTSSLAALYDDPLLQKSLSASLTSSLGGDSKVPQFTQGLSTIHRGGGTSFSSPLVAGMICCYLEVNPNASFVDVRNWLHKSSMKEVPGTLSNPNKYYHHGRYDISPTHPAYYTDLWMESGSLDFGGRNPNVAHFPYSSPLRGKLTNTSMSRN